MNTLRLAIAMCLLAAVVRAAAPNVTFSVEPEEAGQLYYAPMGALSASDAATGRLWFKVNIQNNHGANLTLTGIRVQATGIDISIPRVMGCPPGGSTMAINVITVPHPAPASVTIRLYFLTFADPVSIVRPLVPYAPATPGARYSYPADEGDIGPNEYFSDGPAHGPGNQFWGADWQVYRVRPEGGTTTLRAGGDPAVNADYLGWGVPMRAIADGVVLRTSTGWINNPAGKRAFQKMGEFNGTFIDDVKVCALGDVEDGVKRAASFVRLTNDTCQITIWDISDRGRILTARGSSAIDPAELVTEIAIARLSSTRLATSVRLATGLHRLGLWEVTEEGLVSLLDNRDDIAVTHVSLSPLSATAASDATRVATGVRTPAGNLRVRVFRFDGDIIFPLGEDDAGAATSICTTAFSATRFACSMRSDDGRLKVIVWNDNGFTVSRLGEELADNISRVAAAKSDGAKWITAMRTSPGGDLVLARWSASGDGMTLTPELVTNTGEAVSNTALDVAPGTGRAGTVHATTASVLANNAFQINGWGAPDDLPGVYDASAQNTGAAVTHVSLDEYDDTEYFAGARTTGGVLKLMTWHWAGGGGNSVIVKHGNCRVLYAHFQDGSVDTGVLRPGVSVLAGQVLGRMGNSGASSGPHTHINADRLLDGYTDAEHIAAEAQFALSGKASDLLIVPLEDDIYTAPRPMPYTGARAMQLSAIQPGGEGNAANSFATMNGQGMYDVSLGIRPRLNTRYVDRLATALQPNGRKEPLQTLPAIGGPFPQVIPALPVVPSGGRLYIRGGSYDETMTISSPMIIRRYDYFDTEGSAVIGK